MLTNPSTLGVFERQIKIVAKKVHEAGGLLHYDGANLNAILGTDLETWDLMSCTSTFIKPLQHLTAEVALGRPSGV